MKIRISASMINFRDKAITYFKLKEWEGKNDKDKDLLFFGLFNDRDYDVFANFKGKRYVFWCGTDILNALSDYERKRILGNCPAEHYCENELQAQELESLGLKPKIVVSFLDNVNNFPLSYKHSNKPHIFLCGHDQREEEYGVGVVKRVAERLPDFTFHIYGIDKNSSYLSLTERKIEEQLICVDEDCPNIWFHGKVPEEQFNNEIINYQCGLRPNEHDGFSEVLAKSILMGQYPISRIPYEKIWSYENEDQLVALLEKLKLMRTPNVEGRAYYLKKINNFPWCERKYLK